MFLRRLRFWLRPFLLLFLLPAVLVPDWPAFGEREFRLDAIVGRERRFDFIRWETTALQAKAEQIAVQLAPFLPERAASNLVLAYLQDVHAVEQIEAEIDRAYADPNVADPAQATAGLRAEAQAQRANLKRRQPQIEAIVQRQVAAVLDQQGLGAFRTVWPPVMMHMSPLPLMLIVSPRDRIEQIDYASLVPGLTADEKDRMENAVLDDLDLSALVVPLGGLGTYPAMVQETTDISRLAAVTAHEWAHHWLSFRPLGIRYLAGPELRTINETVASIVEQEIGPAVVARFYPEQVPPETVPTPQSLPLDEPPAFDFAQEMAETRITVDALLADDKIDEAEGYMESRRRVFVENGYRIRKLNQAYFAFYGGYAAEPGGAAGADPIGPMLREIRANSPSLQTFLQRVSGVRRYEDLRDIYRDVVGRDPATVTGSLE